MLSPRSSSPTPDDLYETATIFLDVGMPHTALSYLAELARRRPWNADVHASLADAHHDLGDHAPAAAALQSALLLEPGNPDLHINLGLTQLELDNLPAAQRAFTDALRHRPHDPLILTALGYTLGRLHRYEDAARALERAHAIAPVPHTAILLAHTYIQLTHYTEAQRLLIAFFHDPDAARTTEHHRDALILLGALAEIHIRLRRPFLARAALRHALSLPVGAHDHYRPHLHARLRTLATDCLEAETAIAIAVARFRFPDVCDLAPADVHTDHDRFAQYVACITTDQGALLRALHDHGRSIVERYDQGVRALDRNHPTTAAAHFRAVYRHGQDDPIICGALITAFDMAGAYTDADAALLRRAALCDHPRLRALTLYRDGLSAISHGDLPEAIDRLHALDPLDPALAEHLRRRLDGHLYPDPIHEDPPS